MLTHMQTQGGGEEVCGDRGEESVEIEETLQDVQLMTTRAAGASRSRS
jgi:hypothetical protein